MKGIIGKKIGMTNIFDEMGNHVPCTVVEAGPCVVKQVKKAETDGYNAVQLAFDEKRGKSTNKALLGHFKKANTTPKKKLFEFRNFPIEKNLGDIVNCEIFKAGEYVDVVGTSKGKGFQGVVKRHGFAGVGGSTHGQHDRKRAPGSVGSTSTPARTFPGLRMAGRTGGATVKVLDLEILKIDAPNNLLFIKGAIPGYNGSYVIVEA
ncbi:MAG TPA: 50S ribosomal protein L3 [Chitinophagales bacterium]|nr:50S ribosomal protein L3 [Chitinophagales bacterium]